MAISYTYIFDTLRQYIKAINTMVGWIAKCDTAEAAIEAQLVTDGEYDLIAPVPEAFAGYKDTIWNMIGNLITSAEGLLADESLCAGFLPVGTSTSMTDILPALFRKMIDDNETLVASVVTIGSVTADSLNVGDATLLLDGTLDGASPPGAGWPSLRDYARDPAGVLPGTAGGGYVGRLTELIGADSFTVICTRDSQTDGATEGTETFQIIGLDSPQLPYDWKADGSGEATLSMANGAGILTNGEFEDWGGTTPDFTPTGWTLGTGATVGTGGTIIREATNIKRGTYALSVVGTGAATISINQPITGLTPLKRYLVAFWIKTTGASLAAGTLTVSFTGTGYTAGATEKVDLSQANLAALTAFTLKHFWVNMPESIPADLALTLTIGSTLTSGQKIYIDGMVLAEAMWHAGIAWGIVAGATPVLRDDRWTFSVSSVEGGVQKFFRKAWHVQMPSLTAASTITDTVTVF